MSTGQSNADAVLFNWPDLKQLVSEICWYSYTTDLLSAKKSLNMFKEWPYESTSRKCFIPAVNLVIFMAQRLNMAVLSESEVRPRL